MLTMVSKSTISYRQCTDSTSDGPGLQIKLKWVKPDLCPQDVNISQCCTYPLYNLNSHIQDTVGQHPYKCYITTG